MSSRPVHMCRNAHNEVQARACLALRYRLEGREWKQVARLTGFRYPADAKEAATAHLDLEGDRRGLLVQEAATPRALLRVA